MLGLICRAFRIEYKIRLQDIDPETNVKTLSGFECGVNNSLKYFNLYLKYALENNLQSQFAKCIADGINRLDKEGI